MGNLSVLKVMDVAVAMGGVDSIDSVSFVNYLFDTGLMRRRM
jgi:hypothetical protein